MDSLPPLQVSKLRAYVEMLLRATKEFNLTAIVDREEAWKRHVVESLRLLPLLGPAGKEDGEVRPPTGAELIDVGSGGGVPGMVLAIACPDVHVTLLEATAKKARFLEQVARELGLPNVVVLPERAETAAAVGSPHRERFDWVTARAVAPLRVLLELTVPFAKTGGQLLAVKGERALEEIAEATRAIDTLQIEHFGTFRHPTATVLLFRKTNRTPKKYPRRPGEPKKNPL